MNIVLTVTSIKEDAIGAKLDIGLIRQQLPLINVFHALAIAGRVMMSSHATNVRQRVICTIQKTRIQMDVNVTRKKVGSKYQINFSNAIARRDL